MKKVLEFNLKRNKLELCTKPGDQNLEIKMLKEEIQEFYEATTLAERIDAIADVRYVYEGTQLKYNYNCLPMNEDINRIAGEFHRLSMTILDVELGDNMQHLEKIMREAYKIVCDCNEQKLTDMDIDGKVMKQDDLPNATELIAKLIAPILADDENSDS